jgi:tRNA threonylcarbamoyladenosine biosynthesis protein TsaB
MILPGTWSDRADVKILTIDTSTTTNSVAVTVDGHLLAEYLVNPDRNNSSSLMTGLDLVMTSAGLTVDSLDVIGVTLGPGSFTGVRIGIATVKGLALASGKPVVAFSSLAMLAMNLPYAAYPVCPMFDAKKNEVYAALYRCRELPEKLLDECVAPPADLLAQIRVPTLFIGSGALRYRDLIVDTLGEMAIFVPSVCHQPRAAAGAILAADLYSRGEFTSPGDALVPSYLRASEAELARMKKALVT